MISKQRGIILKYDIKQPYRIILLDEQSGKLTINLEYAAPIERLHVGMLLHYCHVTKGKRPQVTAVEIVDLPYALAQQEIFFFHHILELCLLVCQETMVDGIFELVLFLFTAVPLLKERTAKQRFLMRFWLQQGIQPELPHLNPVFLCRLASMPLELLLTSPFEEYDEHVISDWLAQCAAQHPRGIQCKTTPFRYDSIV